MLDEVLNGQRAIVDLAEWSEERVTLAQLEADGAFPQVIRLVDTKEAFLLYGFEREYRLLGQPTAMDKATARRRANARVFVSIPSAYNGYFEVVSEDGRTAPSMRSVAELGAVGPRACIVRTAMRAYRVGPQGAPIFNDAEVLRIGEKLKLLTQERLFDPTIRRTKSFIRVRVGSTGDNLFLDMEDRGQFTAISDETSIDGVHNIRDLLQKFRLPLRVQLVNGRPPPLEQHMFDGCLRLQAVHLDHVAVVYSLTDGKRVQVIPQPNSKIFQYTTNGTQVRGLPEYSLFMKRCAQSMMQYNNLMQSTRKLPLGVTLTRSGSLKSGTPASAFMDVVTQTQQRRSSTQASHNEIDGPVTLRHPVHIDDRSSQSQPQQDQTRRAVLDSFATTGRMEPVENNDVRAKNIYSSLRFKQGSRSPGLSPWAAESGESPNEVQRKRAVNNNNKPEAENSQLSRSTSMPMIFVNGSNTFSTLPRGGGGLHVYADKQQDHGTHQRSHDIHDADTLPRRYEQHRKASATPSTIIVRSNRGSRSVSSSHAVLQQQRNKERKRIFRVWKM